LLNVLSLLKSSQFLRRLFVNICLFTRIKKYSVDAGGKIICYFYAQSRYLNEALKASEG
jgi:hypothetical protein